MIKHTLKVFAAGGAVALLAGCGTVKYQCPMPSGVACMSAPDVYKATNAPGKAGIDAVLGPGKDASGRTITSVPSSQSRVRAASGPVMPLPKPGDVIPIREQARVMRIWIAPWVDNAGNLNMASRVYSEIEPKRWSVGARVNDNSTNFFPLQVDPDAPAPSAKADTTVTPGAQITASGMESASP